MMGVSISSVPVKYNFTAAVAPTVNDDANAGYAAGSLWLVPTTGLMWRCRDATAGAANWSMLSVSDFFGYQAGNWYVPPYCVMANPGAGQGSTTARGIPFSVKQRITISDLGIRVNTNAAGNVQLALYNADQGTCHPTTLIDKTASISTAAAGGVSAALSGGSKQLNPGLYWLFGQLDSTASGNSVVCMGNSSSSGWNNFAYGDPTLATLLNATSGGVCGLQITNTFGSWGDFTSATASSLSSNATFAVAFKIASVP